MSQPCLGFRVILELICLCLISSVTCLATNISFMFMNLIFSFEQSAQHFGVTQHD